MAREQQFNLQSTVHALTQNFRKVDVTPSELRNLVPGVPGLGVEWTCDLLAVAVLVVLI